MVIDLQSFNRLVQRTVWTVLGMCELHDLTVIRTCLGPVSCDATGSEPWVRLSLSDDESSLFLRITHPVVLDLGLPIDGIYNVAGYALSHADGTAIDLSLVSIRAAAGEWPSRPNARPLD
jgi:hypothetical protein